MPPLETRDRDPYWAAGLTTPSLNLDELRKQVRQFIGAATYAVVGQGPEVPRSNNPVARQAEAQVGRGGYSGPDPAPDARGPFQNHLPRSMRGIFAPKCNQFVWDTLQRGGAPAGRMGDGRIPIAKEWGDRASKIAGYSPVDGQPQPGDVVSNGHHVGIYAPLPDGRPGTVSAAGRFPDSPDGGLDGGVVHNSWGFRRGEGPLTVWRSTKPQRGR